MAEGTPGIYPGTVGAFPTVTDLSTISLTPFVVLASSIANDVNEDGGVGTNGDGGAEEDCVHLIGSHGLGTGRDLSERDQGAPRPRDRFFWQLPTVPNGTLLDEKTYLLTINGCLPGAAPNATAAAAGYTCGPGDGGVSIGVVELDTTTQAPDGGIGIQFAHRAVAFENTPIDFCTNPPTCTVPAQLHTAATAGVWPTFIQPGVVGEEPIDAGLDDAGDAAIDAGFAPVYGPLPTILGDAAAGPTTYSTNGVTPTSTITLTSADPTQLAFGVFVQPLDGGQPNTDQWPGTVSATTGPAPGDLFALPLADIQVLSAWNASTASAPTGFQAGQSYTFILVGDPAEPQQLTTANPDGGASIENPNWNGRGVHILAFPNRYVAKKL